MADEFYELSQKVEDNTKNLRKLIKKYKSQSQLIKSLNEQYILYQNNINEQINNGDLMQRVKDNEEEVDKVKRLKEDFEKALDEIKELKLNLDNTLEMLEDKIKILNDLLERVAKNENDFTELSEEFQKLKEDYNINIPLLNDKTKENSSEIDNLKSELEKLQNDLTELNKKHDREIEELKNETIKNIVDQLKEEFEEKLRQAKEELQTQFDQKLAASEEKQEKEFDEKVDKLKVKYGRLKAGISNLQAYVDSFCEGIQNNIDDCKSEITQIRSVVEENTSLIKNTTEDLLTKNAKTNTRISEQQEQIEAQEEQINQLKDSTMKIFKEELPKLQDQINNNKGHFDIFVQKTDENEHQIRCLIESNNKAIDERIKTISNDLGNFQKQVGEKFTINENQHTELEGKLLKHEQQIINQENELDSMMDQNDKFRSDVKEEFAKFQINANSKFNEAQTKVDLTKRTVENRCTVLDEDISRMKSRIQQVNDEMQNNLGQFHQQLDNLHDRNKQELADIKREQLSFIEQINYRKEELINDITERNQAQFNGMNSKIQDIIDVVDNIKASAPDTGTGDSPNSDISLLTENLNRNYDELRNQIKNFVSKEQLTQNLENTERKINNEFTGQVDMIKNELEQMKDRSTSLLSERVDELREIINNLEIENAKHITQLMDENQKALQDNSQNLTNMIVDMQNTNKITNDLVTDFKLNFNENLNAAKDDIRKMNDLIKLNQEDSIRRANQISESIQKTVEEMQANSNIDLQNEIQEMHDQIKEACSKITQSKIAEDNLQKSIQDIESNSNSQIAALQTKLDNSFDSISNSLDDKTHELSTKIERVQLFFELLKGDSEIDFPTLLKNLNLIKEQLDSNVSLCNQKINEIKENLSNEIKKVSDTTVSENAKIGKKLEDFCTESSQNLSQVAIKLSDQLNSTTMPIQENLSNLTKRFNEFIGVDKIKVTDIINMIQTLRIDSETNDDLISKAVQENDNILQEHISELSEQLVKFSKEVEQTFKSTKVKTEEKIKTVKDELESCVSNIKELFTQLNNELLRISDNGKMTIPLVYSQLEQLFNSTFDTFTKTQENLKEVYNSLRDQLKKVKKDISDIKDGTEDISLSSLSEKVTKNENGIAQFKTQQEQFIEITNTTIHSNEANNQVKISELEEIISSFEAKLNNQIEDVKTTNKITEQKYQERFAAISQQVENAKVKVKEECQDVIKEVTDKFNIMNDLNSKSSEDIENRQINLEARIVKSEKKFEDKLSDVNEKLIDQIGFVEARNEKNVEESLNELREKIRDIEKKLIKGTSMSSEAVNSTLETCIEETNKLKIELTKIRGESDNEESLGNESLTTLSQIVRKMKESNEARFKSIENRNLILKEAFGKTSSEVNNKLSDGDKSFQLQVDSLLIQFQNLEESMISANEAAVKELTEKYSKLERLINKNEATFNDSIDAIRNLLDKSIQANESNSKTQFEKIYTNLKELTKTVNNDREQTEKLVNSTAQKIDDFFKKDNESIKQTIADLSEKVNKKSNKIVEACNKKFSEIDNTTSNITTDHENAMIALKLLLDDSENKLKEMIAKNDKSINDFNQNLENKIDLISQRSDEIQKVVTANDEKEKKDFLKLQTEINENQTSTNSAFDQMMNVIKSHLDKRKQEIKKLSNKVQLQFQQVTEEINNSNSQITKNAAIAQENLENMISEVRKEFQISLIDQKDSNTNTPKKLKDVLLDISTRINPTLSDINDRIATTGKRIDSIEESLKNHSVKNNQSFSEIDEQICKFTNLIDNSQSLIKDKIDNEKKLLVDKITKAMQQIDNIASDQSKTQSKVDSITIEIEDLKKVHFYNAELETFSIKLDEVFAYVDKSKAEMCSFIHSSFLASSLVPIKGDPIYSQATVNVKDTLSEFERSLQLQEKKNQKGGEEGSESVKLVDNLKNDDEIGRIIRNELKSNISVKVIIPKSTRVIWNKTVQISPHQKVTILGEDKETSVIQMSGLETYGGVPINVNSQSNETGEFVVVCDASRCLIDAFSSLYIKNIRIEAVCTTNKNEQEDLRALFVCRGWEAVGPSMVQLCNCIVNSDHSVVNVGGNSFVHVQFDQCRITNCAVDEEKENGGVKNDNSDDDIIYPVMAESGAYPNGYGVVADNGTILAGKKIEWMKSLYLISSESNIY